MSRAQEVCQEVLEKVKMKDKDQPEFIQAVDEVIESPCPRIRETSRVCRRSYS